MSSEISSNQTVANRAYKGAEGLRQAQAELMGLLETVRLSRDPEAEMSKILKDIKRINLPPSELDDYLTATLNAAVDCQSRVIKMNSEECNDEDLSNSQAIADLVSLFAVHTGIENKAVTVKNGNMSGMDYKVEQIKHYSAHYEANNNPVRVKAVRRIVEVGFDLNPTPSSRKQKLMAQVAGIAVLSTILINNNIDTSFADDKARNTLPTKPTDEGNDLRPGKVVKIVKSNKQAVEQVKVTPVRTEQENLPKKIVSVKKKELVEVVVNPPIVNENKPQGEKPVVAVRKKAQQSVAIDTIPFTDQNNNKKNYVRVIPPAPASPPASSVEQAPAAPAPAPEVVPGVPHEIAAARALGAINHNDLPKHIQEQLPDTTNWHNIGVMLEYLMTRGKLTDSQAIGPVANATLESKGVNPGQHQIGGPAFGIVQWEAGRRTALEQYAAEKGKPVDDLYVQLDFMMLELESYPYLGYGLLSEAKSSKEATLIFLNEFERPSIPHENRRIAISNVITDLFNEKLSAAQKAAGQPAPAAPEVVTVAQPNNEVEPFTKWHQPVPDGYKITSEFGPRGDALHGGYDLNTGTGVPFLAAAGGKVSVIVSGDVRQQVWCQKALAGVGASIADVSDPFQKEVHVTTVIDGVEYVTIYAHMSEVSVTPGQIVKAGEVLGKTGDSGCSTGPHAHFEARKNGKPFNPRLLFEGDAWRGAGAALPSDIHEYGHDHDHAVDDGHVHAHGIVNADETEVISNEADHSHAETAATPAQGMTDEQKRWMEAVKKAAELQSKMNTEASGEKTNLPADGYLSIAR